MDVTITITSTKSVTVPEELSEYVLEDICERIQDTGACINESCAYCAFDNSNTYKAFAIAVNK